MVVHIYRWLRILDCHYYTSAIQITIDCYSYWLYISMASVHAMSIMQYNDHVRCRAAMILL